MSETEAAVRVAAPHDCEGEACTFCEWSNPTLLDIPEEES